MKLYPSLEEAFAAIREVKETLVGEAVFQRISQIGFDGSTLPRRPNDPFSDEYRSYVLNVWSLISLRDSYDPRLDEAAQLQDDVETRATKPIHYKQGHSSAVGGFLEAVGAIMRTLDVSEGQSVLEYGVGEGQIALHLARMGVDVSVIDIEADYLDIVNIQAQRNYLKVHTQLGSFLDRVGNKVFDRVLFFEAFHHALDHVTLLNNIYEVTSSNAKIVLAAEPILAADNVSAPIIPHPWGPRLDGLSLNAMRDLGWMELGFQRNYLVHAAMRAGWTTRFVSHPNGLAQCHVLEKIGTELRLSEVVEIATWEGKSDWHPAEQSGRWTMAEAHLPLPLSWRVVDVDVSNFLPVDRMAAIGRAQATLVPGESKTVRTVIDGPLVIAVEPRRPSEFGSVDGRSLGLFVTAVRRVH